MIRKSPLLREALHHTALVHTNTLTVGTIKGNDHARNLLETYGTFETIYKEKIGTSPYKTVRNIEDLITRLTTLKETLGLIRSNDENYPQHLLQIEGAPPALYTKGDQTLLTKKSIGVVGTREPEIEDIEEEKKIIERLIQKEYVIVSGLAKGCDYTAHEHTIKQKGKTIAVLGTPIHRKAKYACELQELIEKEHLLITEYPLGTRTFPSHFAHRNLTTTGLSTEGIIIVRAGDKSGTQHAIRHNEKQGKPLYILRNNLKQRYHWTKQYTYKIPN